VGKTTFYGPVPEPTRLDVINADLLASLRWPGADVAYAYETAADSAALRVVGGGHDVPVTKIRERYVRRCSLENEAIGLSHESRIHDSSRQRGGPLIEVARHSPGVNHGDPASESQAPPELRL